MVDVVSSKSGPAVEKIVDVSSTTPPIASPNDATAGQTPRGRNYSFLHKRPETLDEVEVNGKSYSIPAAIGSCYWAVLKVCYENADQPVYTEELLKRVAELMEDRDETMWKNYVSKEKTTVYRKADSKRNVQPIKPWQERVINNAKTLTRLGGSSQYGMRLFERGHVLRYEYDDKSMPYFILRTNLDCLKEKDTADEQA